jgi:hypothetical protein
MKKNIGKEPTQKNLDLDFFDNQTPGDSILSQLSGFVEANDDNLFASTKITNPEDLSKDSIGVKDNSGVKDFLQETNKNLASTDTPINFSGRKFSQDAGTTESITPYENPNVIVEKVVDQSTHR